MAESQFIPSFANGLVQDPNTAEVTPDYGSTANTIVQGDDNRLSVAQRIQVKKNPGAGEFSDIQTAIDSITDAAASKPYVIEVGPGVYDISDSIQLKEFVSILGQDEAVNVNITDETKPCIIGSPNATIQRLILSGSGVSGTDVGLIEYNGSTTSGTFKVSFVRFNGCHTGFKSTVSSGDIARVAFDHIRIVDAQITRGFSVSGTGDSLISVEYLITTINVSALSELFYIRNAGHVIAVTTVLSLITGAGSATNLIRVEDGAVFSAQAVGAQGYDTAVYVPNVGAAPILRLSGLSIIDSVSYDVRVLHPSTAGFLNGSWEVDKTDVDPGVALSIAHSDPGGSGIGYAIIGSIHQGNDETQLINLSRLIRETSTLGLISGGELTKGTNAFEVDVAAGSGFVDDSSNIIQEISWGATTLTIPADSNRYVTVNSSGVVQLESSLPIQYQKRIILGRVFSKDADLIGIDETALLAHHHGNQVEKVLREAIGALYLSGSLVTENAITDRAFNVSQGEYVFGTTQLSPPSETEVVFSRVYRDGLGGYTSDPTQTVVPNNLYDDGSGTLASVPAGEYVKHTIFIIPQGGGTFSYDVLIGQETHTTLGDAVDADTPPLPPQIKDASVGIAQVITQEGAANFSQAAIDIRPKLAGGGAQTTSVSDHGSLLGLEDDDHPQYFKADGARAMTGNIDLGGNDITNAGIIPGTSTAAPSTNPLAQTNAEGISADKARADHIHNIPTAAPVTIGSSNAEGASTSAARADHVHSHGDQAGGSLHADVTPSTGGTGGSDGFMTAQDKEKLDDYPATPSGINHNTLTNLAVGDVHTQYLALSGVRSMAADLNMGGFNLINVNLVDGVDVSAHATRHLPSGADPLATAAASTISAATTNTEGAADSFSRSDHTHNISTGNVSTQTPDQTNSEGISANLARADHTHNIPAAAPEGSLGGNSTNTEGNNPSFARSNHTHDLATGVVTTQTPDQTNAEGTSNNLARADHTHNIPAAIPAGSLGANTVNTKGVNASFALSDHLHNLATGAPITQGPDNANAEGASNNLARADHVHNIPAATAVNVSDTNAEGVSTSFSRADHTHNVFPVFNTAFTQNEGEVSTTSGAYQQALRLTTPALPLGDYKIEWYFEMRLGFYDNALSRVQLNDTTTLHEGFQILENGNIEKQYSGYYIASGISGVQNIDIDYSGDGGGPTVFIRRRRLFITRIA